MRDMKYNHVHIWLAKVCTYVIIGVINEREYWGMGKFDKILEDVLSGRRDSNINFNDLCKLLENKGLRIERISGSHHIFSYQGVLELIDLQPDKRDHSKAKAYQVKQVRSFLRRYLEV